MNMMKSKKSQRFIWQVNGVSVLLLLVSMLLILPPEVYSQTPVRAGAAYLKILPGARQQNMVGSLTAGLDGTYSSYSNPGATGFLRDWQLSVSYNSWVDGISNYSIVGGKQFRLNSLLSDRLYLSLGLNRQGVDDFNSTNDPNLVASAHDFLMSLSIGVPLTNFVPNLAIGANIKYFSSTLSQYGTESTRIFDIGALYRTGRFRLPILFPAGILSLGVSYNHLGQGLTFISQETPLPRTFRVGAALNMGEHDAVQMEVAADYRSIKDETSEFGLAAEVIVNNLLFFRGGYLFSENLDSRIINHAAIGVGLRGDDYFWKKLSANKYAHQNTALYKNKALRIDILQRESTTFSNVWQVGATWRPIGPEPFGFRRSSRQSFTREPDGKKIQPPASTFALNDTIRLSWQASRDPDLFDDVNYQVFLSRGDNGLTFLDSLIQQAEDYSIASDSLRSGGNRTIFEYVPPHRYTFQNNESSIHSYYYEEKLAAGPIAPARFMLDRLRLSRQDSLSLFKTDEPSFVLPKKYNLVPGDYYWTVMAYDRNHHVRFAKTDGSKIARFDINGCPNLEIEIEEIGQDTLPRPALKLPGPIYFDVAKYRTPASDSTLLVWTRFIKENSAVKFRLAGFADLTWNARPDSVRRVNFNTALADNRATYTRGQLVDSLGVNRAQIVLASGVEDQRDPEIGNFRRVELWLECDGRAAPTLDYAKVVYRNIGVIAATGFRVAVYDSAQLQLTSTTPILTSMDTLFNQEISSLAANASKSIKIPLKQSSRPKPHLVALINPDRNVVECVASVAGSADPYGNNRSRYNMPDLEVELKANEFVAQKGDIVAYTLKVRNVGSGTSSRFNVQCALSDSAVHVSDKSLTSKGFTVSSVASNTCFGKAYDLTWRFPALASGDSISLTMEAFIDSTVSSLNDTFRVVASANVESLGDYNETNDFSRSTTFVGRINFLTNQCRLDPRSEEFLRQIRQSLLSDHRSYEIAGYTDKIGSAAYNQCLSCSRAHTVKNFLANGNAALAARLVARGYGISRKYPELAKNRRVEIRLLNQAMTDCSCTGSCLTHSTCQANCQPSCQVDSQPPCQ